MLKTYRFALFLHNWAVNPSDNLSLNAKKWPRRFEMLAGAPENDHPRLVGPSWASGPGLVVWVKIKAPGEQVFVHISSYQCNPFWIPMFDPQPSGKIQCQQDFFGRLGPIYRRELVRLRKCKQTSLTVQSPNSRALCSQGAAYSQVIMRKHAESHLPP